MRPDGNDKRDDAAFSRLYMAVTRYGCEGEWTGTGLALAPSIDPRTAEGRVTDVVTHRPSVERVMHPTADGGRRAYLLEDPRHLDRDEAEGRDKWPRASCLRSHKAWY
jgi:hypothetical protein